MALLRSVGLLSSEGLLAGRRPIAEASLYESLYLDDFLMLARCRPDGSGPAVVEAHSRLTRAKDLYTREGLKGSDDKDVTGADEATLLGAEFVCSEGWVRRGFTSVAAPLARRLALSQCSLIVAALPGVSGALVAILLGSWTSVFMYRRPLMCTLGESQALCQRDPQKVHFLSRRAADDLNLAAVPLVCRRQTGGLLPA